jgi:hypothetical protein
MGRLNHHNHTHCFYTVTSGKETGALNISDRSGRTKRDEPFNPFAPNASAQRNKRQTDRKNVERRAPTARPAAAPQPETNDGMSELAKKQREAMSRMHGQQGKSSRPQSKGAHASSQKPAPTMTNSVATPAAPAPQTSHADRLAELRRKSELSRQNAKATAKQAAEPVVEVVKATVELVSVEDPITAPAPVETPAVDSEGTPSPQSKDVFKTVQATVAKTNTDRRRKRRRHDKKGGGRQKQEKKLNRQKYLEYKYAAKDILDNPNIPEEHRSNVLGQVWAKGERMGVSDAHEFIDQKVLEEILPEGVAQELRNLVNKMTTRR